MLVVAPIGMLIILAMVVFSLLFRDRSRKYDNTPSKPKDTSDPIYEYTPTYIHVPIQEVPVEFYEAYNKYLKSPEWRALRKLVLKRDKYRCVDCQVKAYHSDYCPTGQKLQVHHIHYDGIETMTFHPDQCVSVCHSCHMYRHSR